MSALPHGVLPPAQMEESPEEVQREGDRADRVEIRRDELGVRQEVGIEGVQGQC